MLLDKQEPVILEAELLILGTGAAGCGAALAAREAGIDVLMVDKGKLESSGCLGGGNDHFKAVLGTDEPGDQIEDLVRVHDKPGSGFTQNMIRQWGEVMPYLVDYLDKLGVKLMRNPDGSYLRTDGRGEPAWYINIADGQLIKRTIARDIRQRGARVLDHVMCTKLLVREGRVVGATGYNVLDGTFYVLKAGAVILALGNSCNRATANSTGNPYNTWHSPFNTGSQYVLAYEAGANIVKMDVEQLATLVPKGYGCAGMNGINSAGAHELNALGERFMPKYHPEMENCPRQFQIGGTYQELMEGKGPPFYMDMRHIDAEAVRHLQYVLMPGDKATFPDYCAQRGIDFASKPMEVELSEIEFSGMLQTGERFESSLPGLYNGCAFYTFSGSFCGGYLAGRWASKELNESPRRPKGSRQPDLSTLAEEIAAEQARIFAPLRMESPAPSLDPKSNLEQAAMHPAQLYPEPGLAQADFERAVRQVMSYYMGYVRNEQGMKVALERLRYIAELAGGLRAENLHELMLCHESLHLLKSCMLSCVCSIERRETGRSVYRRSDYPEKDKKYDRTLLVRKTPDGPDLAWI